MLVLQAGHAAPRCHRDSFLTTRGLIQAILDVQVTKASTWLLWLSALDEKSKVAEWLMNEMHS